MSLPTSTEAGLSSRVSEHFGKAPYHLVIRLDTWEVIAVVAKPEGIHGTCAPVEELAAWGVGVVACRGLGRGAQERLEALGIEILHTDGRTVREVLEALGEGRLSRHRPEQSCAGHRH